jgi:hypothetical protein
MSFKPKHIEEFAMRLHLAAGSNASEEDFGDGLSPFFMSLKPEFV